MSGKREKQGKNKWFIVNLYFRLEHALATGLKHIEKKPSIEAVMSKPMCTVYTFIVCVMLRKVTFIALHHKVVLISPDILIPCKKSSEEVTCQHLIKHYVQSTLVLNTEHVMLLFPRICSHMLFS